MKKALLKNPYFIYSCTFLLLLPIIFLPFLSEGKSFVWALDGMDQHYPALLYYGKLLRELLSGHGFRMFDFRIGMGFDTLTTLNYYVIGDPISLLSVLMTSNNAVFIYDFLIILRIYLAGISFILLMKYGRKGGLGVVLGALIYAFSGYSLYAGLRHPFFLNPMIYLPLIIIGVEKVLKNKKPYILIAMVFVSTLSNFYFLYAITSITVIYVIFRYLTVYQKNYNNRFFGFLQTGFKTGAYYLLGIAMGSVILIPILYAFSRNGRLGAKPGMITGSYLYYGVKYYIKLFQGFYTTGAYPGYWTVLSFSAVLIASMAVIFINKKYRKLQLLYLLALLGLSVPAVGYFMNGFSYASNRWCFAVSLLGAVTFVYTYDRLFDFGRREKLVLAAETIIYGILAFAFPTSMLVKVTFLVLLAILILIFLLTGQWFKERYFSRLIIYALVFLTLGMNGYGLYSRHFNNYSQQFLSRHQVTSRSGGGQFRVLKDIRDNSFYRVETYNNEVLNQSMTRGFHDVSAYFSLMDGNVTSYLKNLEVLNQISAYRFQNLDNRTILDTLASVKYFITTNPASAPYGYQLINVENSASKDYYLFQNSCSLPLGYTYENYILHSDYDKLSALEKQNVMMKAVVLEQGTDYAAKSQLDTDYGMEHLKVRITPDANVSIRNHRIQVKKAGAAITLNFNPKVNSETYIRLSNFRINRRRSVSVNLKAMGAYGLYKRINVRSSCYNSYFGKVNYLIHMGYSQYGQSQAVITFPRKMDFYYDSIDAFGVAMDNYPEQVKALSKAGLNNVIQSNNRIEGDITLDKKGIMALSIPYSKGWSAYVDGKREKIMQANVMYMALPLNTGKHHIVLNYETPYLRLGFLVSLTAFLIFVGIILFYKKTEKRPTDY